MFSDHEDMFDARLNLVQVIYANLQKLQKLLKSFKSYQKVVKLARVIKK